MIAEIEPEEVKEIEEKVEVKETNKELPLVRANITSISFVGELTIKFSETIIDRNISWFN